MPTRTRNVPFADDLLGWIASELLDALPGAGDGDLTAGLVLLPSSRACRDLGHRLLENSGRDALLLPQLMTDVQWAEQFADLVENPEIGTASCPDDLSRALLLADRLQGVTWLEGGPTAAPGLAEAFLTFFDEVRRHRQADRLLNDTGTDPIVQLARTADAETVAEDVARIREVWALYRDAVPVDSVDLLLSVADHLKRGGDLPGPRPELTVVAGFGRTDPIRADLLRAALGGAREGWLVLPEAAHPLDKVVGATWGAAERATDPEAGARRLAALVTGSDEPTSTEDSGPALGERLNALGPERQALAGHEPEFLLADNPEEESLLVAGRVAAWLEANGAPEKGITVATADPRLAARITARLRDAGLDADNTVGEPLSALPAGLLIRFLLRAAQTDLRAEPLLEVLGHPYTEMRHAEAATGTWALRLERLFRRETGPQSGLAGLHRRAKDRDAAALEIFQRQTTGMREFVDRLAEAFAPLLDVSGERLRPWVEFLDALDRVWTALAPERPLQDAGEPDLKAAVELLETLRTESDRLPLTTLSGFAADLGRLMAGLAVTPHRPQGIPIQVTGLVEARLARTDFLILAGLNEGVFPAPASNPVVLPGQVRRLLGLPTWRESRAADAELFLRLLHGAPRVELSWSRRREGSPALPSPLVERLRLGLGSKDLPGPDRRVWLREAPPLAIIEAAETGFRGEPAAIPHYEQARPLTALSWSTLRIWRDCPYRTLLERGFALRADEDVRDEFGKKEYGSLVHAVLAEVLADDHEFRAAMAGGDSAEAETILIEAARARFLPGAVELPVRRLWLDTFLRLVPSFVRTESTRLADWSPAILEEEFELPLPTLADWARVQAAAFDLDPCPTIPEYARTVTIKGVVDRIDRARDGSGTAVIDYKTGSVPPNKSVLELEDLQLSLYALAVETGCVEGAAGPVTEGVFYNLDEKKFGPALNRGKPPLDGEGDLLVRGALELVRLAIGASDPEASHPLLPRAAEGTMPGSLPCKWCDLRGTCRIEERCPTPAVAVQLDKIINAREVTG